MNTAGLTRASCGYESRMLLDSLASTACAIRLGAREETDILRARFNYVRLGSVNLLHYRAMGPRIDDLCGHCIRMTPAMAGAVRSTLDWGLSVGSLDETTGEALGAGLLEMFCAYALR